MYSLTPRFRPTTSQTGTILGPSYYTVEVPPEYKESYVPFIYKSTHQDIKNVCYTDAIYDQVDHRRIIGGSSLKNRAKRVTFGVDCEDDPEEDGDGLFTKHKKKSRTPAPNQYDPTHIQKVWIPPRRTRKLYMCKVPFYSGVKGPSVPSRIDDNGYTVDENEHLIKNPADVVDTSLGPAYYCINQCPNMSKSLYGGCKWSRRTAPRSTMCQLDDNPGPGSYNIAEVRDKPGEEVTARIREMAAAVAYLPRTIEAIGEKVRKENHPGPADYNIQKPQVPKSINKYSAFSYSTDRFKTIQDDLPGPGDYEIPSSIRRTVSQPDARRLPKSLKSKRKKPQTVVENPGPATYDLTRDPSRPKYLKYSNAPFETSAPRNPQDGGMDLPGPADYDLFKSETVAIPRPSSIFQSRCARTFGVSKVHTSALYDIRDDFNRLKSRKEFRKKEVGFNSTSERTTFKFPIRPLPCCPFKITAPKKGYYFPMKKRFDSMANGVPGPGAYMHGGDVTSINYRTTQTFNLRIKEIATGKKLIINPKLTQDQWRKEIRKRKILRVFNRSKHPR